ncbi:MAG TPA: nitroreductase family protein [Firmicutes bacterium]|nr:nitroreductase family protein [Bacillota bacterium]
MAMTSDAQTMFELIKRRRSIRSYTNQDVSPEHIQVLLEAAMAAPSGNDARPWDFVVVRDAALRKKIAETHTWSSMAASAPVVIVVCGDESSKHWIADTSAATENILLQASAMGLGALWVGIYPTTRYEEHIRSVLGIPANRRVLCVIPIGWPAEKKEPRTRYEASKVHYDKF